MLTRRQLRPWDHLSAQEAHKVTTGGVLCKSEDRVRPGVWVEESTAERVGEIFLTSVLCSL